MPSCEFRVGKCPLFRKCQAKSGETCGGETPPYAQYCRHFVCDLGLNAARDKATGFQSGRIGYNEIVFGRLLNGARISGLPFGAGDKPFELSGWIVNPESGNIYTPTRKKPNQYFRSCQKISIWHP